MKKYIFLLILLASLSSVKCKKTDIGDQLPPITTTGANTFGCKVDGKVWLPHGGWNVNAIEVVAFLSHKYSNTDLEIYTNNRKNNALSGISISISPILDTGLYKIYNKLNVGLVYNNNNINYEPFDTFGTNVV
jgi:hypothetical protein